MNRHLVIKISCFALWTFVIALLLRVFHVLNQKF